MSVWVFLRPLVVLFFFSRKPVLETVVNLAEFPQDEKEQKGDYHEQRLDVHYNLTVRFSVPLTLRQ
jgi:hypothetical protein